jgi:hypothetical protein
MDSKKVVGRGTFDLWRPRPSKAFQDSPDLSQNPPEAPQGHQKAAQDPSRRSPKHPKDAK